MCLFLDFMGKLEHKKRGILTNASFASISINSFKVKRLFLGCRKVTAIISHICNNIYVVKHVWPHTAQKSTISLEMV